MLQGAVDQFRDRLKEMNKGQKEVLEDKKLGELADGFIFMLSRVCTLMTIKRVSLGVGVEDLAEAYKEVLKLVGRNNATELIDLSIKLDHFGEFPSEAIRTLHKKFSSNAFAEAMLGDLVTAYMMTFDLDRRTRESMTSLFRLKPNVLALVDPSRKKVSN